MALVQFWKLDDNAASTTVVATTGSNGTLAGGDNTSVKHSASVPGGSILASFDMNGSDDAINIASLGILTNTAFSVSCWFNLDGSTGQFMGITGVAQGEILATSATNIRLSVDSGSSVNFTVPNLGTGMWHHLLLTRTAGNSVRVFLDGTESVSGAQSRAGALSTTRLAKCNAAFLDGRLAWFKVFDSDESANVATLYAEGVTAGGSTTGNLIDGALVGAGNLIGGRLVL